MTTQFDQALAVIAEQKERIASLERDNGQLIDAMNARTARIAELETRENEMRDIYNCMLRAINDAHVSRHYLTQFGLDWITSWARALHKAGFQPTNPEARDIATGLALIERPA